MVDELRKEILDRLFINIDPVDSLERRLNERINDITNKIDNLRTEINTSRTKESQISFEINDLKSTSESN